MDSPAERKNRLIKSVSSITGVPTPDSFAGFSADDDYQPKKPKWPILVCGVVAVALVAGGAWYFLSNQGSITEPGTPSVQYPENTAGVDEQQQAMQDVLQSEKEQRVPSMTQLIDLIAINKLAGTLESEGDGKNANVDSNSANRISCSRKQPNLKNLPMRIRSDGFSFQIPMLTIRLYTRQVRRTTTIMEAWITTKITAKTAAIFARLRMQLPRAFSEHHSLWS